MKSHLIVLSVNRYPVVGPNLVNPLRTAIGLASAYNRHPVTIALHGEGILCGLWTVNHDWIDRYLKSARAHRIEIVVDKDSLDSRGYESSDLHEGLTVVQSDELKKRLRECEVHLRM